MQELAMTTTITTTTKSSLTLLDVANGSDNFCDDLVEATCNPLLIGAGEGTVPSVRLKAMQKVRSFRQKEVDVGTYMSRREMSPFQERMNAITILPNPIFCLYFILAGHWIRPVLQQVEEAATSIDDLSLSCFQAPSSSSWLSLFNLYHYLPSLPPPAIVAIWLGITFHAPFSFLYHYKYAHGIADSAQRVAHWSRRMDHSAIHTCSALLAYATSGSLKYFFVNVLFNADCIYRQFESEVRPRRNQTRVFISLLAYTIPILNRGDLVLFAECWLVLLLSGYCFIAYPLRGWSHAVFHIIISFLPPLLMEAALDLPSSQPYLETAAICASQGIKG